MTKPKRKLLGRFGVDSGQVLIIDPCYLEHWRNNEYNDKDQDNDLSYNGACHTTLNSKKMGGNLRLGFNDTMAVVSSTGLGDGLYEVYATYVNTNSPEEIEDIRISKLEIIFLS